MQQTDSQEQPTPTSSLVNRIYLDVLKREFNITKGVEQFTTQQLTELIRVLRLNASTLCLNGGTAGNETVSGIPMNVGNLVPNNNQNTGMNPPPTTSPSKPAHQPHFYQPPNTNNTSSSSTTTNIKSQNYCHQQPVPTHQCTTPQKVSPMKRSHATLKPEVISLDNSPVASVTDDVIFVKEEVKETTPTKRRNNRQTPTSSPMSASMSSVSSNFSSPMSTTSQGFTTPTKDRKNILGPYLDGSFKLEQQLIHTPLNNNAQLEFSKNESSSQLETPSLNDLKNLCLDQYSHLLFSPSTIAPLSQLNLNSPRSNIATSSLQNGAQVTGNPPELQITNAATPKAHSEKKKSSRKKKEQNQTPLPTIPADSPLALMTSPPASTNEKRKKKFVSSCSEKLLDRIQRALTQRLFLIGRKDKKEYEETFAVLGTTGNVYDVHVCEVPTCSCPDFKRGNFCKHILFVYLRVLRIPTTHYVIYQKALMKAELQTIFSHSPQVLAQSLKASDKVIEQYNNLMSQDTSQLIIGQQRRTLIGTHCPICFEDFVLGKEKTEHCLVCGVNVHEECFKAWKGFDNRYPCPECKTPQFGKDQSSVLATSEGYCNLSQYQPNTPKCR